MQWTMKNCKVLINALLVMTIIVGFILAYQIDEEEGVSFESSFKIHKLTDEEYGEVGTDALSAPVKDDFRKAVLEVTFHHTDKIQDREITVPTYAALKHAINADEMEHCWFGNGYAQDNKDEDFAEYVYEFIFYSRELSHEDIKKLLGHLEINARWVDADGSTQEEKYLLGDIIRFIE